MMTRENQPMSNSYSAPTSNEDASSCRPSKVTPSVIASRPQFDVWMRTEGVDAAPLNPPDDDLGSADTTSQRTVSTATESNCWLNITPRKTTTIRRKATQANDLRIRLVAFSLTGLPVLGISVFTFSITAHLHAGPLTVRQPHPRIPQSHRSRNPHASVRPASMSCSPPQRCPAHPVDELLAKPIACGTPGRGDSRSASPSVS